MKRSASHPCPPPYNICIYIILYCIYCVDGGEEEQLPHLPPPSNTDMSAALKGYIYVYIIATAGEEGGRRVRAGRTMDGAGGMAVERRRRARGRAAARLAVHNGYNPQNHGTGTGACIIVIIIGIRAIIQ